MLIDPSRDIMWYQWYQSGPLVPVMNIKIIFTGEMLSITATGNNWTILIFTALLSRDTSRLPQLRRIYRYGAHVNMSLWRQFTLKTLLWINARGLVHARWDIRGMIKRLAIVNRDACAYCVDTKLLIHHGYRCLKYKWIKMWNSLSNSFKYST